MRVGLCLDELFLRHEAPRGHPEREDRLRAISHALTQSGLASRCIRMDSRAATLAELERAHAAGYIETLARHLPGQSGYLDPDTYYSPGSWEAALHAVGATIDATLAALSGEVGHAAVFVRPPGHHAESSRGMGFCLLSNVAVAAQAARAAGARRVAIVDWDVHHGNGTQEIFWRDPSVLYLSVHQYPFYPGTGASSEIGEGPGAGTTINVPLPAGMGEPEYAHVFDRIFVPALGAFGPEIVLVSAGYDAHREDPLGQMELVAKSYAAMTVKLVAAGAPVVAVLEGGYDLAGIAASSSATLEALLEGALGEASAHGSSGSCAPEAEAACRQTLQALEGTEMGEGLGRRS